MALDSMKIFDAVDRHFKITLTEQEVDDSNTAGEIAAAVCKHISFNGEGKNKHEMMFDVLKDYIPTEFGHPVEDFALTTVLKEFMPTHRAQLYWDKMAADFDIELPMLKPADVQNVAADSIQPTEAITNGTVNDLINWMLALNYEKLITVSKLVHKVEVEQTVIGLVHEITAIGVEDIQPHHDLLNDLGIR